MRLIVSGALGARVVSLQDRRTGREWLAQGPAPSPADAAAWADEDAAFGGAEAFGWDDCLPTISRSPDPLDPGAPALRDHGDFWGREASITGDAATLVTEWPAGRWGLGFLRRHRLDSSAVIAEYAAYNPGRRPVPFLWSAHPLLQLDPGTRLHLPRIDRVRVHGSEGIAFTGRHAGWPRATAADHSSVDLDVVADLAAGYAMKAFVTGLEGRAGALAPDGSWIGIAWDPVFAPILGLWMDYGGWPADDPVHQVALEPTTAAHDSLGDAMAAGQAAWIAPGRTVRWWVRIELGIQPSGLAAFLRG
ncbi:MAG: hypothetical protein QOH61_1040 [Chloroflexota bacterium]|jgi:hypothetical protein|nr:hypothetical protein [Chloroflexota bacterium]